MMQNQERSKLFSIFSRIPAIRAFSNNYSIKSGYNWLDAKKLDDNAEGLWRVHDKLYDFRSFTDHHPGGSEWLTLTHGTDITELFEIHHLSHQPWNLLSQYYIRDAISPKNSLLTFEPNGFYKTLQKRVMSELRSINRKPEAKSKIIIDSLVVISILTSVLAAKFQNYYSATVSAIFLAYSAVVGHNFLHLKDNWRMYYFNLSMLNYRDWRIMHAMSHHIFPNTYNDLGVLLSEPFLCYLPQRKNFYQRFVCWFSVPFIFAGHFKLSLIYRILEAFKGERKIFYADDLVSLILPASMFLFGDHDLKNTLLMWIFIISISCFWFVSLAMTAGHHDPKTNHEGDELNSLDFGVFQISTIIEKKDIRKSQFLVLTHFGDHILHHLFPSLDHGVLPQLNDTLVETCKEFEVELRECPWYDQLMGHFKQLARTKNTFIKK